jgi:hypothetical protein
MFLISSCPAPPEQKFPGNADSTSVYTILYILTPAYGLFNEFIKNLRFPGPAQTAVPPGAVDIRNGIADAVKHDFL